MTQTQPSAPPRIALVTGGGRGIGRSSIEKLAERGIDSIVVYRDNAAAARDAVASVERSGRTARPLRLDVADLSSFPAFVAELREVLAQTWSRESFDVLVHNAGTGGHSPIGDVTEAQFDELLAVHFKGPLFLTQQLLPVLADGARIIQISTGLTRYTYAGQTVYAAMKGGFEVVMRYLARELAGRGITANSVAPGGIVTDFGGGFMRDAGVQATVVAQTPLGRIGMPDDVADIVAALASGDLRWVTGQRIEATGGYAL